MMRQKSLLIVVGFFFLTGIFTVISFDSAPAFHEGAVYADSAGNNLDLSVVTRRGRRQAGDTGTRLKTIVSNYGATSANLVVVDFIIRKWTRNGNTTRMQAANRCCFLMVVSYRR